MKTIKANFCLICILSFLTGCEDITKGEIIELRKEKENLYIVTIKEFKGKYLYQNTFRVSKEKIRNLKIGDEFDFNEN